MQKDTSALVIFLLIFLADIFSAWQTANWWINEKLTVHNMVAVLIVGSLGLAALALIWINAILVRRIIRKQIGVSR